MTDDTNESKSLKHKRDAISDEDDDDDDERNFEDKKKAKTEENNQVVAASSSDSLNLNMKHFSFIVDLNIEQNKMIKAELCGLHLAQKLKDKGADVIIRECKDQVLKTN